jgi:hypothetical protein
MGEEEKSDQDAKSILQCVCVCVYVAKKVPAPVKGFVEVCNIHSPFIDHLIAHPSISLISFAVLSLSYRFIKSYKIMSHLAIPYISVLSTSQS